MSERESASFKVYRKMAHPQNSGGVQRWEETEVCDTLNVFDNTDGRTPILICQVYDARGHGGGTTVPTITGDHQDRITDYTAIVLEGMINDISEDNRDAESGSASGEL